ncbi:hypothetical protein [Marinobacterium lutimaris]|uniref:hypothetical protein n=1 Tax=Marinobacterium lutimaris TaxID=568106 RepID=UPI0011B05D69|nr:hypothetical protein [Marinobacterium lutimaris]
MKCDICNAETGINYGNSNAVLCNGCSSSEEIMDQVAAGLIKPAPTGGPSTTVDFSTQSTHKIALLISIIGWVVFSLGAVGSLLMLSGGPPAVLTCVGFSISGLLIIAAGEVTKSTAENAAHSREILKIMRDKT